MENNIEEIVDEQTLRQLLDESEDFEFRRQVRARLRALKKDSTPVVTIEVPQPAPLMYARPPTTPADKPKPSSQPTAESRRQLDNGQKEFREKSSSLRTVKPDEVNRPSSMTSGVGMKVEPVCLRTTQKVVEYRKSEPSGGKLEPIVLRKVVQSPKPTKDDIPKIRTNASTAKMAFNRFKEIDLVLEGERSKYLDVADVGRGARRRSPSPNSIREQMLDWCRARVAHYDDIEVEDFSSSWSDGMAFCALIHSFYPEAFDYDELDRKDKRKNFQLAFDTAEKLADIVPLLDVEDMIRTSNPDWKCIFTYVNSIANRMSEIRKERKNKELQEREKEERDKEEKSEASDD